MKKFAYKFTGFAIIFYILNIILGSALEIPRSELVRAGLFDPASRWREFYSIPSGSIDVVLLGSSHCYRSFDPSVMAPAMGAGVFNLGSGSQTPVTSYFVLREAFRRHRPRLVAMEVYWMVMREGPQFVNASYNYDFMEPSPVREDFLLYGFEWRDYVNFALPSVRYRNNAADLVRVAIDREKWLSRFSADRYMPGGYVRNDSTSDITLNNQFRGFRFETASVSLKNIEYLRRIVRFCRDNGAAIAFVKSPLPPTSLALMKNYRDVNAFYSRLASDEGVPYIDYNAAFAGRPEFSDADFKDDNHLNASGVSKLSADLAARLAPLLSKGGKK